MADLIAMLSAAAGAAAGGGEVDPNFNQTVLLLHGDGTDGAQNNTFLDSSTNNFTITRNGNTTQGTFSPFSVAGGAWSNYFDGTGDYLTVAYDSALTMPAGTDFCIEAWVYKTVDGVVKTIASSYPGATNNNWLLRINASNKLNLYVHPDATVSGAVSTTSVTANQWFHVAATRSGTTWRLFVNGNLESTVTATQDVGNANAIYIASREDSSTQDWSGYISNYRMVVGSAVYTSSFTPSTSPLTAISNTQLLTCQSNRFVDNSSNAYALTIAGNTSVQPFSPFAPSAAYDPAVNSGSGYFDGTGDYLTVPDDTALEMGTSDFTIECWFYPTSLPATSLIADFGSQGAQASLIPFYITTSSVSYYISSSGSTWNVASGVSFGGTLVIGQWHHLALVRNGSTFTPYFNGVAGTTTTSASGINNPAVNKYIGAATTGTSAAFGYISDFRVVKGTAVYTSAFTPPTAPLTAITNTSLLCNFTNAGIFDNTGKNNLESIGNVQLDTATKVFGTASIEFDGTGDYLTMRGTPDLQFGTGDFTIECWVYFNSLNQYDCVIDFRSTGQTTGYPTIFVDTSSTIVYFVNSANRITSSAVSTGQFYHLAVCRSGTDTKMFIDGVQAGSTWTDTTNYVLPTIVYVGGLGYNSPGTYALDGFIDDLRITKGVARYTTGFTPPTKAFPDL